MGCVNFTRKLLRSVAWANCLAILFLLGLNEPILAEVQNQSQRPNTHLADGELSCLPGAFQSARDRRAYEFQLREKFGSGYCQSRGPAWNLADFPVDLPAEQIHFPGGLTTTSKTLLGLK